MVRQKPKTQEDPVALSDEALVEVANNLRAVLHRSFYLSLLAASFTIYLLYESFYSSPTSQVKQQFADALSAVDSVLQVGDILHRDQKTFTRYAEFMESFLAISSASEQAIVGVSSEDERWLRLDPVKRDTARRRDDSVVWLEHNVMLFKEDKSLRELPFRNVTELSRWIIFVDERFDNENARKILEAQLYVARELGQKVSKPNKWPQSFFISSFAEQSGYDKLTAAIQDVRAGFSFNDIVFAVDRLNRLCEQNQVTSCTPNGLDVIFADEPSKLIPGEEEKINISFVTLGIEKELLAALAPLILLILFFRFIGYENRWRAFVEKARAIVPERSNVLEEVLWAVTDGLRPALMPSGSALRYFHGRVMFVFVTSAMFSPIGAQAAILVVGIEFGWHFGWLAVVGTALTLSAVGLVNVLRRCWFE